MLSAGRASNEGFAPHDLARLKPTAVYGAYWAFAAERQAVFFRRLEGYPPPWTQDVVLQRYKFTNAYRASDRVSQYLIRNVIHGKEYSTDPTEVVFRILLFKLFNRIGTWELIKSQVGHISSAEYSYGRYERVLSRAMAHGQSIYSGAYIMPSGGALGHRAKHRNHLKLIERMISAELPARLAESRSMRQAFELLLAFPTIGRFLAYQLITDINYSTVTNFEEDEFVAAGPGAIDGISKCFEDKRGLTNEDIIRLMSDYQESEFERLGLTFRSLWGRRLQLIDCQNLFCEVDKYARVAHPSIGGRSGRSRIKQRFRPNDLAIDYWYPPKWGINEELSKHHSATCSPILLFSDVWERRMDFQSYQLVAGKTDRNPGADEIARMIPLAGLTSEAGELLGEYKKYLRDGESHKLFKDKLSEELGDLLWYVANVATKFGLDLSEIASRNLEKCERRWGKLPDRSAFDAAFPQEQRFPRQFSIDFLTYHDANDAPKVRIMYKGQQFGNDLSDNSNSNDGYGYHDVLHLAFAAVLGWSPLVRSMLKAKRKRDENVDQVEDGGRAIATEEGLSAMIFAYARDYGFLEGKSTVSAELLRMIQNMVRHLEVAVCTAGEWERAIVMGFEVWRKVMKRGSGTVDLDLDERRIVLREG